LAESRTNIEGKPFDFSRWRDWLKQKVEELLEIGFEAKFSRNDFGSKPSAAISAKNARLGGYFSNWVTGESDFQVLDFGSVNLLSTRWA
jgi:hypothetical protein